MVHYSLKERAYRIIKEKLLNMEYSPGSRLREDMLAEEISMSRTPVREAINRLATEGFVDYIPRRGVFVVELTNEKIQSILDIRENLESLAVKKCVEKITDEEFSTLSQLMEEFSKALESGDYALCNKLDNKFHLTIAQYSRNEKLYRFISEIEDFMRIARNLEKQTSPDKKCKRALDEHLEILKYIKVKDIENSQKAMKINIKSMRKNLGIG